MNEKQKTDELFRKALNDYREEMPSLNTEKQVFRKLTNMKYLRLLKTNLSILAIAIPVVLLAYFLFTKDTNINNRPTTINPSIISYNNNNNNTINPIQTIKNTNKKTTEINKPFANQNSDINDVKNIKPDNILTQSKKIDNEEVPEQSKVLNNIEKQVSLTSELSEKQDDKSYSNNVKINQLPADQIPVLLNDNQNMKEIVSSESKDAEPILSQEINLAQVTVLTDVKTIDSSFGQQNEENLKKKIITKSYNSFAIELSGNLYYVDSKLSAANELSNHVKVRNANETGFITFSPGIELKFNTKNFFLQTGINYQMVGEKLNYFLKDEKININTVISSKDSLVYIPDPVNNPPGHWEYDTLWFTKYDTSIVTTHRTVNQNNTFKYFEIPLLVGKSFALNRFILDVSTGISLGILLKADAQLLSTDNNNFNRIEDKHSPYMNDLTMSYLLRISFRYQFNEKWSVFARPALKYNLGSILNENQYPVRQKYALYGIGIGVMYKF